MTDPANVQDSIWSGMVVEEIPPEWICWDQATNYYEGTDWPGYDYEPIWNQMQAEKAENRTTAEIIELVDPIYQDDSDPDYNLTGSIDDIEIDWGSDDEPA